MPHSTVNTERNGSVERRSGIWEVPRLTDLSLMRKGSSSDAGDEYQAEPGILSHLYIPTHLPSVTGWYPSLVDVLHWDFPQVLKVHTKHCLTRRARDPEFLTCSHRLPLWDHLLTMMVVVVGIARLPFNPRQRLYPCLAWQIPVSANALQEKGALNSNPQTEKPRPVFLS